MPYPGLTTPHETSATLIISETSERINPIRPKLPSNLLQLLKHKIIISRPQRIHNQRILQRQSTQRYGIILLLALL